MKFIKKLFVLSIFALSLVLTGCLNFDNVKTLEFVQAPQSIYYLVGVDQAMEAQEEVLKDVTVKINGNVYTLFDAISGSTPLIQYEGLDLTTEGTKTLIVTLRDDPNVRLTYVYKVVDGLAYELFAGGEGTFAKPYLIETPQQFMNIATKVYGTPTPSTSDESDWETYYNAVMPYFTNGVYFKITKDLDFAGITYYPLGVLGGQNFVPFTGTIDGAGHKISNLNILAKGEMSAMFGGLNNATIKNLTFENAKAAELGTKYSAIIFARPPKVGAENTNVLYNINLLSGQVIGQRAAGFATEASNTMFVKCNVSEAFKVIGVDTNNGAFTGFVTGRSYSYANAISTNESAINLSWTNVSEKLAQALTNTELSSVVIPTVDFTLFKNDATHKEGNKVGIETGFVTAILDCNYQGSLLRRDLVTDDNSTNSMMRLTGSGVAVYNSTFSKLVSSGTPSTNYQIFYTISCLNNIPHNVYSILATSEKYIKLKYNADGSSTDYANDSDVIDNKIYLSHDIYGNPVIESAYYFTMTKVSVIKVYLDSSSNIIGFDTTELSNPTPIFAGEIQ